MKIFGGTRMKHRSAVLAAFVALAAPLTAWSQDTGDRRFYASPMVSYGFLDDARNMENSAGGHLFIGKKLTGRLNLEIGGYWMSANPKFDNFGPGERASLYSLGGGFMLFPSGSLPWLFVPLTVYSNWGKSQYAAVATKDYRSTVFDTGLGLLIPLGVSGNGFLPDGMSARIEGRYRYDQHGEITLGNSGEEDAYDFVFNAGVFIPLTHTPKEPTEAPAPAPEVVPAPPADSDGDTITDDRDQCPDTPAGSTINEVGCPLQPPLAECSVPGPGQQASLAGCKEGQAIVLSGVNFDSGKATLTGPAKVILDSAADALKAAPDIKVEIGGHTDDVGSDASNQRLSERRAKSVKSYLAERGVAGERMGAKGYGASQPLVGNDTPEGREQNRRVEFKVVAQVEPDQTTPAPAPVEAAPAPAESAPALETLPPAETAPAPTEAPPTESSAPAESAPALETLPPQ
jgi:outer membrane protein OmpA-like peptidoglycan-associated protein